MEYCGEVMDYRDFQDRAEQYDRENRRHYYFMTLRADEVQYSKLLVLIGFGHAFISMKWFKSPLIKWSFLFFNLVQWDVCIMMPF